MTMTAWSDAGGAVVTPVAPIGLRDRDAMRYSDRWVQEGCNLASPLVGEERAALVRSYAALLGGVHRV